MDKTEVHYYITLKGVCQVKDFIDALQKRQKAKVLRTLQVIEEYGIEAAIRHIKKLTGPLWEIRTLGKDNIRILYVIFEKDSILLLHGFVKKSQKIPQKEIQIALARLKNWQERKSS